MLLDGSTSHGPPSMMDSPILARVERAMMRQEGRRGSELANSFCCQQPGHAVKRGILLQQRDKIFSRWKERYFILTQDYLHCFKRASGIGNDKISEMGAFIFKVKLVDVERVEWINKKSYSTVALDLGREGKILLRCNNGLEDWFELLEMCTYSSKERRKALRHSHDVSFREKGNEQNVDTMNSTMEEWILAKRKIARLHADHMTDSVPDISSVDLPSLRNSSTTGSVTGDEDDRWSNVNKTQRLSLLTDIDTTMYDTPPQSLRGLRVTPTPYRLNSDVFFMPGALGRHQHRLSNDTRSSSSSFRIPSTQQHDRKLNRFSIAEDSSSSVVYSTYSNTSNIYQH